MVQLWPENLKVYAINPINAQAMTKYMSTSVFVGFSPFMANNPQAQTSANLEAYRTLTSQLQRNKSVMSSKL